MTLARRARLASGLAPTEFAKLIGADPSTYLSWETGNKKPTRTAVALMRLIEADPEFCFKTLRRTRTNRQSGTVLIVVDDEEARSALWDVCEDEGYDVATVSNGWEAIEHLKRNDPPCAIVLDVTLPLINGWQLMSWLRQQSEPLAGTPVITLSADPTHAQAAGQSGVVRHFEKPIDVSKILEEIKSHCKTAA